MIDLGSKQPVLVSSRSVCIPHSPEADGTCGPKSMEPIRCRKFWTQMGQKEPKDPPAMRRTVVLFSGFLSAKRAQQLSTLRHLWIFAPVAQDHLEGTKAAVSESAPGKGCKSVDLIISVTSITA